MIRRIASLNAKLAIGVTLGMSTMTCVYLFLVWSLLPLAFPRMQDLCMYVSTTVVQLVALPLIMVGQNLMGREQVRRSKEDHEALLNTLTGMQHLLEDSSRGWDKMEQISERLDAIEKRLQVGPSTSGAPLQGQTI